MRKHKGNVYGCLCAKEDRPHTDKCYCSDPDCWCIPPDPWA